MSGLMNMVSKFTRGNRTTTSGRGRPGSAHGMGSARRGMGGAPRGRTGGHGGVESFARRLLHRAR